MDAAVREGWQVLVAGVCLTHTVVLREKRGTQYSVSSVGLPQAGPRRTGSSAFAD